jgi:hypothetical protein
VARRKEELKEGGGSREKEGRKGGEKKEARIKEHA